ncbi:hypothetical protein ACTA71_002382 [Dictyostelium dimigraforme]
MDYQFQLDNLLKKTRINLLQFDIQKNQSDPNNILYKANLKLIFENKPLRGESDWELSIEEAKDQCSKRVYDILMMDPHADVNRDPEGKPLLGKENLFLVSIILNIIFINIIKPSGLFILLPFLTTISIILIVPWILYRNKRILLSTGNRVIVRKTKSYDKFCLPIKYVNHRDLIIDISNGVNEGQDVDQSNFLATAKKYIVLNLVETQDTVGQSTIYKVVPGCGLRIRKSKSGLFSSSLRLKLKDGRELYYFNGDISTDSFTQVPLPIFKVMSKSGIHFFPAQYSKPIDMKSFEKYKTIANLNLTSENNRLPIFKSNWVPEIDDAKNQCSRKAYDYLINEPSVDINSPDERPLFDYRNIILVLLLSNIILLMKLFQILFYILIPFLITIIILLSIPWILYRNKRIIISTGSRVIVRTDKSYDKFRYPVNYINHKEILIDISNGRPEIQDIDQYNFLAIAKKNITLTLVPTQDNKNENRDRLIQQGSGMRIRENINGGNYTCTLRITLRNGKELIYFNNNVPKDSFTRSDIPIFLVRSKYGLHFFPDSYTKTIELNPFQKYQAIISIHFDWLIYLFFKYNDLKNSFFGQ